MSDWRCPTCGLIAEIGADRAQQAIFALPASPTAGRLALRVIAVACPNQLCGQLHVTSTLHALRDDGAGNLLPVEPAARSWDMIPGPQSKELPPYAPEAAAREFSQAVQVLPVSPNAAATLARRCLQALVRDFFGVKGKLLSEELDMIKDRVDGETWEAIEAVRRSGNVELHFERGVSVMADADNEEPQLLIGLIEYLVENWYVARRRRQQRLATIKNLAPTETTPRTSRRPPSEK